MLLKLVVRIAAFALVLSALTALASRHTAVAGAILAALILVVADMRWHSLSIFGRSVRTLGRKNPPQVALTFDDGPSEWTPLILDVLDKWNVKATFFLIGAHVRHHPEIARRIAASGHTLGIHTMTHRKLHLCGPRTIRRELDLCLRAFARWTPTPEAGAISARAKEHLRHARGSVA